MEERAYKSKNLTVNWDLDNKKLLSFRNIRIPNLEISFNRDFLYPYIWVVESESYNLETVYSIKERARYFSIFFLRRFFPNIEELSSLAMKLAAERILLFFTSDDVYYFLRKMLLIKESAGIVTAIKNILENPETESEKSVIQLHSINVGEISNRIATMLGEESKDVKLAGYIHDIGKICIPASILFSDKNFDYSKSKIFQLHVFWGELLYEKIYSGHTFDLLKDAISFHHERVNGQGYMRGISKNIPKIAKIIAVSDVFTALTSDRPYRLTYDKDVALAYIISKAGELFDPEVVEAFKKVV